MRKVTPFLWFDGQAEDAVNLYCSVFPDSKVLSVVRYGDAGPGPKGAVMTAAFQLAGEDFVALNGGPQFKFTPAISFSIDCKSQEEIDHYWEKLSAGGKESQCGWLEDQFGLSWQVVPTVLGELLGDPDPAKSQRVMEAMLKMTKLDIAMLQAAHAGA